MLKFIIPLPFLLLSCTKKPITSEMSVANSPQDDTTLASEIISLPQGGSSQWDEILKTLLLTEYDMNGSGSLDSTEEVLAISCPVWNAIDTGMRNGGEYNSSFVTVYGLDPELIWVGYAVGLSEDQRAFAYSAASDCLSSAPLMSEAASDLASQILQVPNGGSSQWDEVVKNLLLAEYDQNNTGTLDTQTEVQAMSCPVWQAVNQGMINGGEYTTSIVSVYGFDPELIWVGYALGFTEDQRANAYAVATSCISGEQQMVPQGTDLATQILSLPGGGSSQWDEVVKDLLLAEYDQNNSGTLDTQTEVQTMSCPVWQAVNQGMINGGEYTTSIVSVYGFDPELIWVGYALGFTEDQRANAYAVATSCISGEQQMVPQGTDLATQILSLPGGGSSQWDEVVKDLLLAEYDQNNSGTLDTQTEVQTMSCPVWQAVNQGMINGGEYTTSIVSVYGFDPGLIWVGYALGFTEDQRANAYAVATSCIDENTSPTAQSVMGLMGRTPPISTGFILDQIQALPEGGSSKWDHIVNGILISSFDTNKSGTIDTASEVNTIGCPIWKAIETSMLNGGEYSSSIISVYGFDPSLSWVGYALGFTEDQRDLTFERGAYCLSEQASMDISHDVPSQILGLPGGGSSQWDEWVEDLLITAYDSDGSQSLDTPEEVDAISCSVWSAVDKGMLSGNEYTVSFVSVYGFDPDLIWVGYALGFSESQRSRAYQRASDCLSGSPPLRDPSDSSVQISQLYAGGSNQWDQSLKQKLLEVYDLDGSGSIDSLSELEEIQCPIWKAMDTSFKNGEMKNYDFLDVYGFSQRVWLFKWPGESLGFSKEIRTSAYTIAAQCY